MTLKITERSGIRISRREFLAIGASAGAGLLLAGCGAGSAQESVGSGGKLAGTMEFQTWAGDAEREGFEQIIRAYERKNPEARINLRVVPFAANYQKLQISLAAGQATDLARIQYQQMGQYSSQGALLDLSGYLPSDYGNAFTPALWNAVTYEGKPYGMPQHTDTMAIFYNVDMMKKAGITDFPQSPEEAWTWGEFIEVARKVKRAGVAPYPFAVAWQNSAYRWMWFLFQHGGQLLTDDLEGPAIDDSRGIEAIEYTQGFFRDNLVPPSTSVKSNATPIDLFTTGTTAMVFEGNWNIPTLMDSMDGNWGVTYMIRDAQTCCDLGGNAVVATRDAKNPALAADFLQFLGSAEQMRNFCVTAGFIPTRKELVRQELDYDIKPEDMEKFVEQSQTVKPKMAAEQTVPGFPGIQQVLQNQLEAAFKTGKPAEDTAKAIADDTERALAGEIIG